MKIPQSISPTRSSSSVPPSPHTPVRAVAPKLRDLPLKERPQRGANFPALHQGSRKTAMPDSLRAPSTQHAVPVPGQTQAVPTARTSAVPPTGNSSQQRDRAAASQVSAATVSAESEIRSWGLYRNVPKLFTGPSASPSAVVRVKGNVLEGTSYSWFPGPLT